MNICACDRTLPSAAERLTLRCSVCGELKGFGRAPTASQLVLKLDGLKKRLRPIAEEFHWAQNAGWSASAGESVRSSGPSNPTLGTLIGRRAVRTRIVLAARLIDRADEMLEDAHHLLKDANRFADPHRGPDEYVPDAYHDPESFPQVDTRAGIEEARMAHARRRARGEGFGDG